MHCRKLFLAFLSLSAIACGSEPARYPNRTIQCGTPVELWNQATRNYISKTIDAFPLISKVIPGTFPVSEQPLLSGFITAPCGEVGVTGIPFSVEVTPPPVELSKTYFQLRIIDKPIGKISIPATNTKPNSILIGLDWKGGLNIPAHTESEYTLVCVECQEAFKGRTVETCVNGDVRFQAMAGLDTEQQIKTLGRVCSTTTEF